jgi:trafficking protein particle complex subunit 8
MSSDEMDIRSGLFLEQAAQCYLAMMYPQVRKYAFYLSLAGHRFNKVSQKQHAERVYKYALDIYNGHCWYRAEDYINFMLSRSMYSLKNTKDALMYIERIINKNGSNDNKKRFHFNYYRAKSRFIPFFNETNVIKDFILYNNLIKNELNSDRTQLPSLTLPLIEAESVQLSLCPIDSFKLKHGSVLINGEVNFDQLDNYDSNEPIIACSELWSKLETILYISHFNSLPPLTFRPQQYLFNKWTNNKQITKVVVNELISISFEMTCPLKIPLRVSNCTLLWTFNNDITNENEEKDDYSSIVDCSTLNDFIFTPGDVFKISLTFIPRRANGNLSIIGLKYQLGLSSESEGNIVGKQLFNLPPQRLNTTPQTMKSIVYQPDNRLNLKVVNPMPLLQVEMDHLPTSMLCNQIDRIKVYLVNLSDEFVINNLKIATTQMSQIYFRKVSTKDESKVTTACLNKLDLSPENNNTANNSRANKIQQIKEKDAQFVFSYDDGGPIGTGGVIELEMWLKASDIADINQNFNLLFFYTTTTTTSTTATTETSNNESDLLKYRLVRHRFSIKTTRCLTINNCNIIETQTNDANILFNLEINNSSLNQFNFDLVDVLSVSDIWKVSPINNTSNKNGHHLLMPGNNKTNASLTLKIKPNHSTNTTKDEIHIFKTPFHHLSNDSSSNNHIDLNVFLHFLNSDLKLKCLINKESLTNYLDVSIVWKATMYQDGTQQSINKWGLLPIKFDKKIVDKSFFQYQTTHHNDHQQNEFDTNLPLLNQQQKYINSSMTTAMSFNLNSTKHLLLIETNHQQQQQQLNIKTTKSSHCLTVIRVDINLVNISSIHNFDILLVAKNIK